MTRAPVRLDTSLELLLDRLLDGGQAAADGTVLATIVGTAGSTYRKAGARMAIGPDGALVGLLSGGCLEQDLRGHAATVRSERRPRIVEYDMRGDDDLLYGIGAGCEGAMRILLEPADAGTPGAAALAHAAAASRDGRATALAVVHEGPASELGTRGWPGAPRLEPVLASALDDALALCSSCTVRRGEPVPTVAWVQYVAPPPRLLICGAGVDAEPVARHARALGWPVTVVDHRPAYVASPERFAGAEVVRVEPAHLAAAVDVAAMTAAVVMSHHLPSDAAYLRSLAALASPGYVGLLGPRPRRERLTKELGDAAHGLAGRLRGPVGLDLGATTPDGIALAIVAELHAWVAGRPGTPCSLPAGAA
jgi:xanthine/CO dehydrogenase XdhC/CoxF family maturation factor